MASSSLLGVEGLWGFGDGLELQSPIFVNSFKCQSKAFVFCNYSFFVFVFFFLILVYGFRESIGCLFDSRSLAFLNFLFSSFLMEEEDLGPWRERKETPHKINGKSTVYPVPLLIFTRSYLHLDFFISPHTVPDNIGQALSLTAALK